MGQQAPSSGRLSERRGDHRSVHRIGVHQSTRAPEIFTSILYFSASRSTMAENSAGVLGAGSAPKLWNFFTVAGARRTGTMAALSSSTMSSGVEPGTIRPNHV